MARIRVIYPRTDDDVEEIKKLEEEGRVGFGQETIPGSKLEDDAAWLKKPEDKNER